MIFVTVGTQLPFDRLVKSVDEWASNNTHHEVIIQSGISDFTPKYCTSSGYVEPEEWEQLFIKADLVIAHAGMGTIIKCLDACKPLIVLARKGNLGEHRNDHQIATASKFVNTAGVIVLTNEQEITSAINDVESGKCISNAMNNKNLNKLINELREFSGIES